MGTTTTTTTEETTTATTTVVPETTTTTTEAVLPTAPELPEDIAEVDGTSEVLGGGIVSPEADQEVLAQNIEDAKLDALRNSVGEQDLNA